MAGQISDEKSVAGRIFGQLDRLERIRKSGKAFLCGTEGEYTDLLTRCKVCMEKIKLPAYGFYYLSEKR